MVITACCRTEFKESKCSPSVRGNGQSDGEVKLTYDTEGLPGKAQTALPSSVAAAASCRPDAYDILQTKHNDHHKLLLGKSHKQMENFERKVHDRKHRQEVF